MQPETSHDFTDDEVLDVVEQCLVEGLSKDERPVSYEGVSLDIFDYPEFWDLHGLQAWADVWAAKA